MNKINQNKNKLISSFLLLILGVLGVFIFNTKPVSAATYESTFTSQVFDNYHSSVDYGTISWTADTPASTSLVFSVRAGNTAIPDGSWTGWSVISNSSDSLNAYDGYRYIQYEVILGTDDEVVTPTVYDVSLTANTSSLVSSVFDSEDSQNIIYGITWDETLPGASDAVLQVRTSPDNSIWSDWCGPDNGGAGCETESWFSDSSGGEVVDEMFSDQSADRYFQYRVILISDNSNFPVIDNVNVDYGLIDYSLTYTAGSNGSITGTTSQTIDEGEDGTAVTAVPDTSYYFVDWSDSSTDNPRTDTNVTGDITVTANFEEDATSPIYRFWSDTKQGHFYTSSSTERNYIIATYPENVWSYEGVAYNTYSSSPQLSPIYRFWSDTKQHHFFTISETEKDYVIANYPEEVWNYEGVAWSAFTSQKPGTSPVYRFWSDQKQGHFYTISGTEKNYIIATYPENVWKYEGIAWYAVSN